MLATVSKLKIVLSIDTLHFGNKMFGAVCNIFWFTFGLKKSTIKDMYCVAKISTAVSILAS